MPLIVPRQGLVRARRDGISRQFASGLAALSAAIAVLMAAAAAVAFSIT
jgi:hypothetical protein